MPLVMSISFCPELPVLVIGLQNSLFLLYFIASSPRNHVSFSENNR